jgi:two-component sensor histidine kinase
VVFTEILVNAIKHSVAGTEKPLVITWSEGPSDIVFTCSNPSTFDSRQREKSKGSGRGHKFLRLIVEQMDGHFIADVNKDDSVVTMVFPRSLMRGTA